MSIWDHLAELRRRILFSLAAVAVGAVVAFIAYPWLLDVLRSPYCDIAGDDSCQLYATDLIEPFATQLKVAGYAGIMLAMPVLLWQLWRFIAPGLYSHEKRYAIPFVAAGLILFGLGATLAYITLPQALGFLTSVGGDNIQEIPSVSSYLTLIVYMMLAFGVGFEVPLLLVALQLVGVITPQLLARSRRIAAVIIVAVAAVITPSGDPITLIMLSIPMYLLYEAAILIGWLVQRRSRRAE
jgi:sec-independent protein translocase protein TatC